MKKHLGILLLLALTAPLIGTYAWLYMQKQQVRREIKQRMVAGIDPAELVLIKLSRQDAQSALHWEHDREFEFQGRMYDVVKRGSDKDSLWFYCWPDEAETSLNKRLEQLLAGATDCDPQRREAEHRLLHFLKSLFLPETSDFVISPSRKNVPMPFYGPALPAANDKVPVSPPPEKA